MTPLMPRARRGRRLHGAGVRGIIVTRSWNPTCPWRGRNIRDAEEYMEHVLERWRAPLCDVSNERLETPEYPSQWQTRYCIDSMLEHAVMHPIRYAFQLDELIQGS